MSNTYEQYAVMANFSCLGAACPDTCCRGWDMPADSGQRAHYAANAPELLATIDLGANIMKREATKQQCAQLCEGSCSIHTRYGTDFLGDACYFYPRLMHNIGGHLRMSGAISCPEMLRLVMTEAQPFARSTATTNRLPTHRRDRVPAGWNVSDVNAVVDAAMQCAGDEAASPEHIMKQLLALAEVMDESTPENWRERWNNACAASPAAEAKEGDSHILYYALALTEAFGDAGVSSRLAGIMHAMELALDCHFDRPTRDMKFGPSSANAHTRLWQRWRADAQAAFAPMLRRWIQAQLAATVFPFGGFGEVTFAQRGAVLVQRFATTRLALMCHVPPSGAAPDEQAVMDIMQGIARFIDHLADAKLTLMIFRDAALDNPARLRGLIGAHSISDDYPRASKGSPA